MPNDRLRTRENEEGGEHQFLDLREKEEGKKKNRTPLSQCLRKRREKKKGVITHSGRECPKTPLEPSRKRRVYLFSEKGEGSVHDLQARAMC